MKYRQPPVGNWFTVRPWSSPRRRLRRMPWLARTPPRCPTNLDEFLCPASPRRDRARREPRGDVVTGHQLPLLAGRDTTSSAMPTRFFVSALHRRLRRGGTARARGVRLYQQWVREIRRPTRSVGLTARAVLRHRLARQIDGFGSRLEERAACTHLRRSAEAGRPAGRPPPCSAPWTLCPELANRMSLSLLLNDEPARPPASSIGSHLPPRLSAGAAPSGSGLRCGTTPSSRALPGEATGDGEDDRIPDWADPA